MNDRPTVPASKIPEGELRDIPWVCCCNWDDKLCIYTPAEMWGLPWTADSRVCQSWQDVHEVLHPYWPPDHDHGTLDQMPEGEVVRIEPVHFDLEVYEWAKHETGRVFYAVSELEMPYLKSGVTWTSLKHQVIARPNYDPRVTLGLMDEGERR